MIAVGIVLFVVAFIALNLFGGKWYEKMTRTDMFWTIIAMIGVILIVVGMVIWCWKHLP